MNRKLFFLFFVISIFSCKSTSLLSSYGVDKGNEYFSVAVLPDTQYYTALKHGGTMQMFHNQIDWIISNQKKEKIAYVIHLGDITDHNHAAEWDRAKSALYRLDDRNIPYGLSVGNHDETPNGTPPFGSDTTYQTKYFGRDHFRQRPWYGGAMGSNNNNDNHFDIFTANDVKYLVLYFAFNQSNYKGYDVGYGKAILHWADSVLSVHSDRKAILVTHSMLGKPKNSNSGDRPGMGDNAAQSNFTQQGKEIYEMAKQHSNVFLMLGGHISGEGYRKDSYNGNVIKTYLSDYQSRQQAPFSGAKDRNGGGGTMRLMRFNKTRQTLSVLTFIPGAGGSVVKETDGDSQFTHGLFN